MKHSKFSKILLVIALLLFTAGIEMLFARAGGGGTSSRNSGGGGGDLGLIYLIFYLMRILPFPLNIIALGAVVFFFIAGSRKAKNSGSAFRTLQNPEESSKAEGLDAFMAANPDFSEEEFMKKFATAFTAIQNAWSSKKISNARRFITDGVYQRFATQIKMMELLKQTNRISDIKILNTWIDKVETDGDYDVIHAGIHAYMKDSYISEISPALNSRVDDKFIEYWSFIRRKNSKKGDLYTTVTCPNCNAPLTEEHLDVVKCPFCGTLLNNGEFDWILSEITQANDYVNSRRSEKKLKSILAGIPADALSQEASVQLIEDKASNGYLQILTALTLKDLRGIKRFTSSTFAQKLKTSIPEETVVYNRLFLNSVTLIGAARTEEHNLLYISVRSSFQRILLKDGKYVKRIDPFIVSRNGVIIMKKKINAEKAKGSLYAGSCPACGAPVEDPFAVKCSYCGTEYNREDREWIIDDILTMEEYAEHTGKTNATAVNPDILDSLYDVRDYALNNMMMIVAADGVYGREERELIDKISRKFGYKPQQTGILFNQAASGRLSIMMPEDRKKREKIYSLMVKAAMADRNLGSEEKQLLDHVKEKYLS